MLYSAAAWSVGTQVIRADRVDQLPVFSYADGHQPCSRGLYTHYYIIYKDSLLRWMTIPNIWSFDPSTNAAEKTTHSQ